MSTPGYTRLPSGNFVKDADGSGPYVFDGATMTLEGTSTGSGSGGGGGSVTMASGALASGAYAAGALAAGAAVDGWDLTQGAIADAAVTAGATGSVSAKLRSISRDVGTVAAAHGAQATAAALAVSPATDAAAFPVSLASGKVASGAVASGAIASGAVAAGALATGAGVDGWDLQDGTTADAVVAAGAAGTASAKLRAISRDIGTVAAAHGAVATAAAIAVSPATDAAAFPVSLASGKVVSGAIASGAFASGSIGSGAVASGAIASGAIASGAVAAGALAAGAGVDGWDLQAGATTDAAVTAGATGSASGKLRAISRDIGTVAAAHGAQATAAALAVSPATDAAAFPVSLASGKVVSGAIASGAFASGSIGSGAVASGAIASGAFASGSIGSGAVASGAIASGAFASGSIGSGAVASGAIASGAVAAGALAAGAGVDGWDLTEGAIADAAVTAGATGSVSAKLRSISRDIGTVAAAHGAQATAAALAVSPATDSANFPVTSTGRKVRLSITRPANTTAYTANDVIGGTGTGVSGASLTFAGIGPANGHVLITSIDLMHEVTALPSGMTSFRLYLYSATPPSALADNAAWDLAAGDTSSFIGYVDFATIVDLGSNLFVQADNVLKHLQCDASGNVYGYLVTNGGWTPGANSTVFDITLRSVNA